MIDEVLPLPLLVGDIVIGIVSDGEGDGDGERDGGGDEGGQSIVCALCVRVFACCLCHGNK